MRTITIDDRRPVVNMMLRILNEIDPEGEHLGTLDPMEVLAYLKEEEVTVLFMDVEMPKMDGITLAKKVLEIDPKTNIIFITGYKEYMPEAFELYASAYLLKPIEENAVREALNHLRYFKDEEKKKRVRVQCFGNFEVFLDNRPMSFHRSKSEELFAYLIDRKGAVCTTDMILGNLWPDKPVSDSLKSYGRTVLAEMIHDFEKAGIEGLFTKSKNGICINTDQGDCDYYRFLDNDEKAIHQFRGEYMTQYEFAMETRANLSEDYWL